jgi:outer membrane immunogenic protein
MNHKLFLLSLCLVALSGITLADSTIPKSTYDWTGVYVGGFIGGATGSDVSNTASYDTSYTDSSMPSLWTGPEKNNYSTKAGFIGGGTVGYNWQIGKTPYLVGLEGEYGFLSQKGGKTDPNVATYNTEYTDNDNSQSSTSIGGNYGYGLVGGRLGYALDRSLIYIKSGAVFTTVNSSWSDTAYALGTSNKATTTGYALGAGFEYALPFKYFTNVTVKTEYLYFGIPTSTTMQSIDDNGNCCVNTTQTTSGIHTAKIGVNYKF